MITPAPGLLIGELSFLIEQPLVLIPRRRRVHGGPERGSSGEPVSGLGRRRVMELFRRGIWRTERARLSRAATQGQGPTTAVSTNPTTGSATAPKENFTPLLSRLGTPQPPLSFFDSKRGVAPLSGAGHHNFLYG